jgi:riboflavin kinase/FMN adenylyltransferase
MAVYYSLKDVPQLHRAVITIGTFDGVHKGHSAILQEVVKYARDAGGESVLITFEPHPRKLLFPNQPLGIITPLQQKVELITQLGIKHIVVIPFTPVFAALSATNYIQQFLVKNFNPYTIIIGHDHHFGADRRGNIHLLRELSTVYNYKVHEIPVQLINSAAVSSTKIRHALQQGQVKDAAQMLGRNYSLQGIVGHGKQLGRTLGFPTANLIPDDKDQIIPKNGVYFVQITLYEKKYFGILNIGTRPTINTSPEISIEVHIFQFNENIYDMPILIEFEERLRDEKRFKDIKELISQIEIDKIEAENRIKTGNFR